MMRFSTALTFIAAIAPAAAFAPIQNPINHGLIQNSHNIQQAKATQRLCAVAALVNGSSQTDANTAVKGESTIANIRLSVIEKAKTVTSACTSGTLCTTSHADGIEGAPFGSFVDFVLDDEGSPVLLMNEMSMHTMNIAAGPDDMVTLFCQFGATSSFGTTPALGQDVSRCSVTGKVEKIDSKTAEDIDALRMRYSINHAYADQVMDSPKFAFYRLVPHKLYFVGGFGVLAKWVDVEEYRDAAPDILAREAGAILSKLNKDHGDDLELTAVHLLGCTDEIELIRVTNVDRLGMDIRVTTKGKRRNKLNTDEFRIGFRIPVISVEDAKSEILKVFQEAWEKGNGYTWENDDAEPGSDIPISKIAADNLG
uniref:DUF2470 domain-containing protein n=1 Tax=Eucampia antarctica TaxID=49252 RepID=A0A7S2R0M7_9STRA|mmetsp:Transcript_10024/g.9713  ORF Transcript_10024/g.9713 Transcript_10024/m.9713 type:complete len:368 (+) Transcript_10024:172-1275(+)|eukprot:CAMPEP_0197833346 /NCGR_PEP_ID=MMETSP1437-20131217/18710_1 /TAXON_ID=49252 ORGANISM="Eucampia antarctica, Strain CCMP1452" /NCGR_SAMPLE_ID=MMETSP1437 /ASSEMBLY_ACC=CAM_ASM_001096 /LENGTH=367 /DNA_ID=CAMNT_0043437337 /DNA_START=170 /DNA_END=1273 /DNA_ORIENTATION=-